MSALAHPAPHPRLHHPCARAWFAVRAYLVNGSAAACPSSFTPEMFASRLKLLDATLTVTVDISAFGCGCNAGFYLVSMPGVNQQGQPNPSQAGDYYCDANQVGGTWCPEIGKGGVVEGASRTLARTPPLRVCPAQT